MSSSTMRVGIIGGGLMGREAASAFGRWFVLENFHAGQLGDKFGCATSDEAVQSHELFAAALESHTKKAAVAL